MVLPLALLLSALSSLEALVKHCLDSGLARCKVPTTYHSVEELSMIVSGKVRKRKIERRSARRPARLALH
jgi:hypothetical protein